MTLCGTLASLRQEWDRGNISFARLVLELEGLVALAQEELSEEAGRTAFHAWGQLEIINALALDAGSPLSPEDTRDALDELERLQTLFWDADLT